MKIGVNMPEQLIGFDGAVLRDFAVTAEELGFDYLTCLDHVLGAEHEDRETPFPPGGIYTEQHVFHEVMTLFAYLASATSRIELTTAVLVLPQRQTALVAKQAAQIALMSGNRLRLGVGSGWNHIEYEAMGAEYKGRGRRLEAQVNLLRRLWSEPILDVDDGFHRIDRAGLNPLLAQPVPIWFGGFAQVQQDRCARIGDGMLWGPDSRLSRAGNESIRKKAEELGRDPDSLGFQAGMQARDGRNLFDAIKGWEAAGGTHATLNPAGVHAMADATPLRGSQLIEMLPRLREEVGDLITS